MKVREWIGGGILGVAYLTASALGLAIHVWTIIMAFLISGFIASVLTFVFPVISETYWFFKIGFNYSFGNIYCVSILAYIGLFVIGFLGVFIASTGD